MVLSECHERYERVKMHELLSGRELHESLNVDMNQGMIKVVREMGNK